MDFPLFGHVLGYGLDPQSINTVHSNVLIHNQPTCVPDNLIKKTLADSSLVKFDCFFFPFLKDLVIRS